MEWRRSVSSAVVPVTGGAHKVVRFLLYPAWFYKGSRCKTDDCGKQITEIQTKGPMRALLVQAAKKLLQVENPLRRWGLQVAARRGRNKAAVAVARKLCVAVWHLLQGHKIGALERLDTLTTKLGKFATELGLPAIKQQGYQSKEDFVQQKLYLLKSYP